MKASLEDGFPMVQQKPLAFRALPPVEHPLVYVGDGDLGRGLFARIEIPRGATILRLTGPLIDFKTAVSFGEWQCYPLQVGPNQYLDLEPPGVFANHSCEPNAGVRPDLNLVALHDIHAGQEIRYDYSTTMDEDFYTMECLCKSQKCRKRVTDFKELPLHLQHQYLTLDLVQDFIRQRFESQASVFGPRTNPTSF